MIFKIKTQKFLHFVFPLYLVVSEDFGILFWFSSTRKDLLCPAMKYQQHWHSFNVLLNFFSKHPLYLEDG